jgi:alkanesulfonate monooxygenase
MTLSLHWFLPTAGDSRAIAGAGRAPTLEYLGQVARAADQLGFEGVLTPTGTWCEDAWVTTAALLSQTRRLRFLVAFRPGTIAPTLAAQMAGSYQRLSGGRLALNVVTGGEDTEMRRFGPHVGKDARYARTAEFLQVIRGAWEAEPFSFAGEHYDVQDATTLAPPPRPAIYFGGASPAAERVAARHADVYLAWGEPPEMLRERLARVRALAAAEGRALRFGVRLHVISRDRAQDAWAETERLLAAMDPATVQATYAALARSQSEGQRRMAALHGGNPEDLVIAPNLWAGVGLVRGGAGTALVGSHEEIAQRIAELHELGFDELILSGHPHLEEAYAFAEGVTPLLRRNGLLSGSSEHGAAPVAFVAPAAAR